MTSGRRVLPLIALAIAGCATVPSVADRAFASGDYAAAAAAYEEALRTNPRARRDATLCLRLGIAYARPGTPAHDPERAISVLKDVAARFPKGIEAAQASLLVPGLEYEKVLTAELAAGQARIKSLEVGLAAARDQGRGLEAAAKATSEQVQRLRASLADKEVQLRRVREELEQLKRIDLQRAP
ncbi:MAG: hypothetical protein LAO05_02165 [Acidobacteriia bacterium]|nr:hypothetical protein [Terriglobia bacterium]